MKIIYHDDMDGICSAAIVSSNTSRLYSNLFLTNQFDNIDFYPFDYKEGLLISKIEKDDRVWLLDFSPKQEEFDRLLDITKDITWIDHHGRNYQDLKLPHIEGLREAGQAACELTWKYVYPSKSTPNAVSLLADYDRGLRNSDIEEFQAGIKLFDLEPDDAYWAKLFNEDNILINEIKYIGVAALLYQTKKYDEIIEKWAFRTQFEGYQCLACNSHELRSELFNSIEDENYDIGIIFNLKKDKWQVELRTERDDIDLSEIAKKHGGGGHRKAAGFVCDKLPF